MVMMADVNFQKLLTFTFSLLGVLEQSARQKKWSVLVLQITRTSI